MREAISNTSPLILLHRIRGIDWLPILFDSVWTTNAVIAELDEGGRHGYPVPDIASYDWLRVVEPISAPAEWLSLDLGLGELTAMALALENPQRIIILDDGLARRTAHAAGLMVWGSLRILLEAKARGLIQSVGPLVDRIEEEGLWMSDDIKRRILKLAGE